MLIIEYVVCYSDNTWNIYNREFSSKKKIENAMEDIKKTCEEKVDNLVGVYLYGYTYE